MKLLLDEDLSRRLVPALQARFPGSNQVPRLIHLALGNTGNDAVLAALLASADRLHQAFDDPAIGVVVIA